MKKVLYFFFLILKLIDNVLVKIKELLNGNAIEQFFFKIGERNMAFLQR